MLTQALQLRTVVLLASDAPARHAYTDFMPSSVAAESDVECEEPQTIDAAPAAA